MTGQAKRIGEGERRTILRSRILELIDIVEAPGQRREHAFQSLKAVAASLQDLDGHAPYPLKVELMVWKAEIFFNMTLKDYARPKAKNAVLRAIRDLQ